jgi:hypothetical protein
MAFERPDDIFDSSAVTGIPLFTGEFMERILEALDFVPDQYTLDIEVHFEDMSGFSEAQLSELYRKNAVLRFKKELRLVHRKNRLALMLCGSGLTFVLISIILSRFWTEESVVREIVFYLLDIVATVPFWGAMDIYFIQGSEKLKRASSMKKRALTVSFRQKLNGNCQ